MSYLKEEKKSTSSQINPPT